MTLSVPRFFENYHDQVSNFLGLKRHGVSVTQAGVTQERINMSKQNYLCIQRSQPGGGSGDKPSPTQMEEMYAKFSAWKEKYKDNIVDMGGKLGEGKFVTTDGVTDGPFVEAKEVIGGFMIVSAESLEEAIEVASGVPGLVSPGSGVEVRTIHTPGG